MSALFDLHTTDVPEFATTPNLTAPPSTIGERFSADLAASNTSDRFWNIQKAQAERYGKIIDDIHTMTGERLANPATNDATMDEIRENHGQPYPLIFQKRLDKLRTKAREVRSSLPEGGFGGIEPGFLDPDQVNPQIAAESRGAREAAEQRVGTGGGIGAFAGGAVGEMANPFNILTAFLPATRAPVWLSEQAVGMFMRNIGREAVYQGLTQGATQVVSSSIDYASRSQIGTQQTAGEFAGEVLGAAGGGFVLGGAFRATIPAWLQVRRLWGAGEYVPTAVKDAALTLEGKALYGEKNPLGLPASANESALDKAVTDVALNRPADVSGIIMPGYGRDIADIAAPQRALPSVAETARASHPELVGRYEALTTTIDDIRARLNPTEETIAHLRGQVDEIAARIQSGGPQTPEAAARLGAVSRAREAELQEALARQAALAKGEAVETPYTASLRQQLLDAQDDLRGLSSQMKEALGPDIMTRLAEEKARPPQPAQAAAQEAAPTPVAPAAEAAALTPEQRHKQAAAVEMAAREGVTEDIRASLQRGETPEQISERLGGRLTEDEVAAVGSSLGIRPEAAAVSPELQRLQKLADDIEKAPPTQKPLAPAPEQPRVDKPAGESPEDKAMLDQAKQIIDSPEVAVPPEKRAAYNDALKQEQEARVAVGCLGGGAI